MLSPVVQRQSSRASSGREITLTTSALHTVSNIASIAIEAIFDAARGTLFFVNEIDHPWCAKSQICQRFITSALDMGSGGAGGGYFD